MLTLSYVSFSISLIIPLIDLSYGGLVGDLPRGQTTELRDKTYELWKSFNFI